MSNSNRLVITEKPSVARSVSEVLGADKKHNGYQEGNGYIVTWCFGHLAGLVDADKYDPKYAAPWKREVLPIIPEKWESSVFADKKEQFNIIKNLMERPDVSEIICATDAGREGELIFRFVYDLAGCKKPFSRLWISSMEQKAILEGFKNLRNGSEYDNLYASAISRAKADWLVGINGTRLFSVLHRKKQM